MEKHITSWAFQPLPVPEQLWTDIWMDFIDWLPNSKRQFVAVYRLSKHAHLVPFSPMHNKIYSPDIF